MKVLITKTLLKYSLTDSGEILPHYLDERDHPWLMCLIQKFRSFSGKRRRELTAHLVDELPMKSPVGKRKLATHVLNKLTKDVNSSGVSARKLRAFVFTEAAKDGLSRVDILKKASEIFCIDTSTIEAALFADLPSEKLIVQIPVELTAQQLALRTNLLLIQGLICQASNITINFNGNSRSIIQYAKYRGLICTVIGARDTPVLGEVGKVALSISGPYSIFRKTTLYGRALSGLVPKLAWCSDYHLTAECVLKDDLAPLKLHLQSGAPLFPSEAPKEFDSRLEERFARDFQRLFTDWDLIREPEPVSAEGTLIFPDFCIRHRRDPSKVWLLEIVGFWTADYLERKLRRLQAAKITNLILCIDEKLNCTGNEFVSNSKVLFFRNKVDPTKVMGIIAG